jgi:hypothetical protein
MRVAVVSVAEPLYRERPYTGYADPREEKAHGRLLLRPSASCARTA